MGPHENTGTLGAQIEIDGSRVIIHYSDGYTVRLDVEAGSKVLRMHLGLPEPEEVEEAQGEGDPSD